MAPPTATTAVTTPSITTEEEELENALLLRSFRHWVRSLDWQDLQRCMTFRLDDTDDDNNNGTEDLPLRINSKTAAPKKKTDSSTRKKRNVINSTADGNHWKQNQNEEWDLLQQMVALQAPLPTPIHPRAIPYEPAWAQGKWNDPECVQRHQQTSSGSDPSFSRGCPYNGSIHAHVERSAPRLLRWIPVRPPPAAMEFDIHEFEINDEDEVSSEAQQQLLSLLLLQQQQQQQPKGIAKRSMDSLSATGKQYGINNASFPPLPSSSHKYQYTVTARHFRQDHGTNFSVASTRALHYAEWAVMQGTTMILLAKEQDKNSQQQLHCTSFHSKDSREKNVNNQQVLCGFNVTNVGATTAISEWEEEVMETATKGNLSQRIYHLLRIASRGNFATVLLREKNGDERAGKCPMFASWFDATDRWFSLAMYLASRFEVALWQAFYQQRRQPPALRQCPGLPLAVNEKEVYSVYGAAVARTLQQVMQEEMETLIDSSKCHLRDGILWALLSGQSDTSVSLTGSPMVDVEELMVATKLWSCPLIECGTIQAKWIRKLRWQFQHVLAEQRQLALILELEELGTISDETSMANNTTSKTTFARRKMRKKGKVRASKLCTQHEKHQTALLVENTSDAVATDDSSTSSECITKAVVLPRIAHPSRTQQGKSNNSRVIRDRNQHTVIALSVLEDVIDNVFREVGLKTGESTSTEMAFLPPVEEISEDFLVVGKKSKPLAQHDASKSVGRVMVVKKTDPTSKRSHLAPGRISTLINDGSTEGERDVHEPIPLDRVLDWDKTDHALFPQPLNDQLSKDKDGFALGRCASFLPNDPTATIRTSNLQGFAPNESLSADFFQRGLSWEMPGYSATDGWGQVRGRRDESILSEFFHAQNEGDNIVAASSTAASVASSDNEGEKVAMVSSDSADEFVYLLDDITPTCTSNNNLSTQSKLPLGTPDKQLEDPVAPVPEMNYSEDELSRSESDYQSPSPPSTPSPTLSPILVSLSDVSRLPKESLAQLTCPSAASLSSEPSARIRSLLNERQDSPQMVTSLSRDNLRATFSAEEPDKRSRRGKLTKSVTDTTVFSQWSMSRSSKSRDDHDIIDKTRVRRSADALSTYRNAVSRSVSNFDEHVVEPPVRETQTRTSPSRNAFKGVGHLTFETMIMERNTNNKRSTLSETAFDGNDYYEEWHEQSVNRNDDLDHNTITKDGTTTISSGVSNRESDEVIILREQRNAYRDLCLTLGAEVGKLKNLLAAQRNSVLQPEQGIPSRFGYAPFRSIEVFDPASVTRSFHIAPRPRTLAATSDAGYRGEHESLASEDDVATRMVAGESSQHFPLGVTIAQSEASFERPFGHDTIQMPLGFQLSRDVYDNGLASSMQSRLARDIFQYLEKSTAQMIKLDFKIQAAIKRMNQLVKTVWPRAQVKLYGSHVTGLCVRTSDLDFVVCLPAVHKNAVAVAPGALEGRNAINETSQKLLARRLKGESWIDPRSIKLIDRTAVPVIKVATKDTKKNTLHLDISFDGPGHHGLQAAEMTASIIEELPLLRPLVVILKQFLIERSLLEAYTGSFWQLFPWVRIF